MPGEVNVMIETEDSSSRYEGKVYFKCTNYNYNLTHFVKFYDLGMIKIIADLLSFEMTFPPLATDFGKHTETFDIMFVIKEHDFDTAERKLMDLVKFTRFKSAFADQCFLYIGPNIKEDGTRLLGVSGKGIEGKISSVDSIEVTKEGHITGRLKFIQCIDLFNW